MKLFVSGGRKGAREAAQAGHVAVIVDALRASATTASLLHYGVREIIVVEGVEEAFAEARKRPGALLAGERGCVKVEGFDLGNSPLQAPPERLRHGGLQLLQHVALLRGRGDLPGSVPGYATDH